MTDYLFRSAQSPEDIQQIRRLNHQVFSDELGQHPAHADGELTDPFEARSRFIIVLHRSSIIGMVCLHDAPPWSVSKRLADPAVLESLAPPLLEVRLLAVAPEHRHRLVIARLFSGVFEYALQHGHRTVLISGIAAQIRMYRRLGFVEIGRPVAEGRAIFYPMALDLQSLPPRTLDYWTRYQRRTS